MPIVLGLALAGGCCLGQTQTAPGRSVEDQIRAVPQDSPVELRLGDGSKLRGWVGEVAGAGFVLTQERKGQLEKRQLTFEQVRSVKQVKSVKPGHTTRNILIGVGVGVAAVAVLIVALATSGGYL